jgi:hypothetical protein
MLFRLLDRDKVTCPTALFYVALGLILIGFALIFRHFPALHGGLSLDHVDFAMGFLVGLGIVVEVVGIGAAISGHNSKSRTAGPQS